MLQGFYTSSGRSKDSHGNESYNLSLSEKRARLVRLSVVDMKLQLGSLLMSAFFKAVAISVVTISASIAKYFFVKK